MGRDELTAVAAYQPEPTAVAAARRFVRDTLQEWITTGAAADGHGLVDDAVLLTSELVTNAVVHAGTPVEVVCRLASDEVEVLVSDGDPAGLVLEPHRDERDAAERTSGRGLLLPAALASAWGVSYGRAAKAVWFRLGLSGQGSSVVSESLAGGRDGGLPGEVNGRAPDSLAAALRHAPVTRAGLPGGDGVAAPASVPAQGGPQAGADVIAGSAYDDMLAAAVESARAAVGAEAAYAVMTDEDGDLRLRAAVGSLPGEFEDLGRAPGGPRPAANGASPPSVVTVPFMVDGRVVGLLAAASASPSRFGDADSARLQRLADRWGPALERARLAELERVRRGRIGALAEARALLGGSIRRQEAMALAGRVAVPRLASWCAVVLADGTAVRPAYVRHVSDDAAPALGWLLDRLCDLVGTGLVTGPPGSPPARPGPGRGPVWRWPLTVSDAVLAPAGAEALAGDDAWCFPFGKDGARGAFLIGRRRHERLPREVTELAADLACRIGVVLQGARKIASRKR